MNLHEALKLRSHAIATNERADKKWRAEHGETPTWTSSPYSGREIYVVTQDGERFGVMWFEGEYSSYMERVAWDHDEWERENMAWLQGEFNPAGEWAKRIVLAKEPPYPGNRYPSVHLDCGHLVPDVRPRTPGTPFEIGDTASCHICQEQGVGWVRGMEDEPITTDTLVTILKEHGAVEP